MAWKSAHFLEMPQFLTANRIDLAKNAPGPFNTFAPACFKASSEV
jgi:hypothetical protein